MNPTPGRIVHFIMDDGFISPALITAIEPENDNSIAIVLFTVSGFAFVRQVPYADTPTPSHWSWPPRA